MQKKSIYLVILIAAATVCATAHTVAKRIEFVNKSRSRLATKARPEELRGIQTKAQAWRDTKSEKNYFALTDDVYATAKRSDTKSTVTISSSAGSGAAVKYQTLGQRKRNETPTTAKSLTELTESMYIGVYHIWTERGGRATSDKDAQFEIADKKEKVVLQEE